MGTNAWQRRPSWFALTLLSVVFLIVLFAPGRTPRSAAQGPTVSGPTISAPIHTVSQDVDVRSLPSRGPLPLQEVPRSPRRAAGPPSVPIDDRVRQSRRAPSNMPGPLANFEGLNLETWGAGWPPDPNGDVGPNHYVQAVNIAFGIFDKSGNRLFASTFDNFFHSTGTACDSRNGGDPVALYDTLADRWLVSDLAWVSRTNGPFYECIAVSKTADPVNGGWWQYALPADQRLLNDYPKLALWGDAYYLTANMFNSADTQISTRVWALDRAAMLQGQPLTTISFDIPCADTCYTSLLPANLRGTPPPVGTPEFLASIDEPNLFHLWKFHADWATPGNSTLTGPFDLTVAQFAEPCFQASYAPCVPEKNGESVDAVADRLMMQLQYRNLSGVESLWATHSVAASNQVGSVIGIRWYEIRDPNGAPFIRQQGTYQPDSNYRFMGSLAVDRSGNMAVGYSVSSASMFPAIRYAGRLATDPLGILGQDETSLIEGTGSQSGGANRWGDYSGMSVDPVDDCTFWHTNMYYVTTSRNWHTRIGSFRFPGCSGQPPPPATATPTVTPTSTSTPTPTGVRPPSTPMPSPVVFIPPTPTPIGPRCEDAYEPDDAPFLAHVLSGPELHNFTIPGDQDWVKFTAIANWVYSIKADPPANLVTEPLLELYVDGAQVAQNAHAFGNIAELWWWNNGPDRTVWARVTELANRGECGNTQYTLTLQGFQDRP